MRVDGPEIMTQAVLSRHVPVAPDVKPQRLIAVSNPLLATSYGCNILLWLYSQGSLSATSAITVHQC